MALTIKVKVLESFGPSKFTVRPVAWEGRFYQLQSMMEEHFNYDASERNVATVEVGDTVCVRHHGKWCRAVVVSSSEDRQQLNLRLVDVGRFLTVSADQVKDNLPVHLLEDPGLSIWCHLYGVPLADVVLSSTMMAEVLEELFEEKEVELVKRGDPVQVDGGHYSIPVDIAWTTTIAPGPLRPSSSTFHSLTEKVLKKMGADDHLDQLLEPSAEEESEQEEFASIFPLEDAKGFRWLPPELPRKKVFSAFGTFVDQSGQIYLQYVSKRDPVKPVEVIGQLLAEKFRSSCPEGSSGPLEPGQACCVLWRDDSWYRGTVLEISQDSVWAVVYLVDFGNCYRAKVEDIRQEVYAHRIPVQAFRVELAGVRPLGPDYTWYETALEFINSNIENKIRVELVDTTRKPPTAKITVSSKKLDLGEVLSKLDGDLVELGPEFQPSESVRQLREFMDKEGLEVVPAGTYKERNPYLLLQEIPGGEEETEEPGRNLTFPEWSKSGLQPGDRLRVKIVEIKNFRTVFLHPNDPSCQYLVDNLSEHEKLFSEVQRSCARMPPVFQPREGLLVAAQYSDYNNCDGWYRAEIKGEDNNEVLVYFVDYGTTSTISDTMKIKEIPTEFARLPVLAIKLELLLENLEEEDIIDSLMMEELHTEERDVVVRISSLGEEGTIRGHLEVEETGEMVYRNLIKEGVVRLCSP